MAYRVTDYKQPVTAARTVPEWTPNAASSPDSLLAPSYESDGGAGINHVKF